MVKNAYCKYINEYSIYIAIHYNLKILSTYCAKADQFVKMMNVDMDKYSV